MFLFHIQYGAVSTCNVLLFISEIHSILWDSLNICSTGDAWWLLCNTFQLTFLIFYSVIVYFKPWLVTLILLTITHLFIGRTWTRFTRLDGGFSNIRRFNWCLKVIPDVIISGIYNKFTFISHNYQRNYWILTFSTVCLEAEVGNITFKVCIPLCVVTYFQMGQPAQE